MSTPILVDTDILIDFLRGNPKAEHFLKSNSERIILSSVVIAELYAGVKGDEEMDVLNSLTALFPCVPISTSIAKEAGLLKNRYFKSHGTGLADAMIAATAIAEHADLKTLNTKHYPMFKGIKPPFRK